jgi:uncharacterized protein
VILNQNSYMKICRTRNLHLRKNRFFCSNPIHPQQTPTKRTFDPEILKANLLKKEQENEQIKAFNPEILKENILKNQQETQTAGVSQISVQSETIEIGSTTNDPRTLDPELLKESISRDPAVEEFDRSDRVILEKINDVGSLDILPTHENMINGFNDKYFNIGSVAVFGSVVVFHDSFFMWRVKDVHDITVESLSIFEVYSPVPSLLIIGTGHRRRDIDDEVIEHFSKKGISIEFYSSADAASTLNFLLQEGRSVAGALIPIGERYKDQFRS